VEQAEMNTGFILGNLKEDHLEHPGIGGRIILKRIFEEIGWKVVDWIQMTHNRSKCMALVNTEMNLRFSYNVRKFLTS
jgi:hypothetical protein